MSDGPDNTAGKLMGIDLVDQDVFRTDTSEGALCQSNVHLSESELDAIIAALLVAVVWAADAPIQRWLERRKQRSVRQPSAA